MLVIKMLKKITGKNNIELAKYLGKSRNTITSWESNEDSIPETEKIKISNRFDFPYEYWNVGLNKNHAFYQIMYSNIKKGYFKDNCTFDFTEDNKIDEILKYCDGYFDFNTDSALDNEFKHYWYLHDLLYGIDPINKERLEEWHFMNVYKDEFNELREIIRKLDSEFNDIDDKDNPYSELDEYLDVLKKWRYKQAKEENKQQYQILSDNILKEICLAYFCDDKEMNYIKGFPKNGIKWKKYYKSIINELEIFSKNNNNDSYQGYVEINPEDLPFY